MQVPVIDLRGVFQPLSRGSISASPKWKGALIAGRIGLASCLLAPVESGAPGELDLMAMPTMRLVFDANFSIEL